jgi:predicted esterase
MPANEFRGLRERVVALYQRQRYTEALAILEQSAATFPQQAARIYNWRMCLANLSGDPHLTLEYFQQAVKLGLWWPAEMLRSDPDLASLQGTPAFEELVGICEERAAQARAASRPQLSIRVPQTLNAPVPLLVALHGRNSGAMEIMPYWEPLLKQGWIIAAPTSSQILGPNAYGWDNQEIAKTEVQTHLAALQHEYPIDSQKILFGGFSQGGGLAIWLALQGRQSTAKFLAIAPFIADVEQIAAPDQSQARGYVIYGDADDGLARIQAILERLKGLSVDLITEEVVGLGHEFPPQFAQSLQRAMNFFFMKSLGLPFTLVQ